MTPTGSIRALGTLVVAMAVIAAASGCGASRAARPAECAPVMDREPSPCLVVVPDPRPGDLRDSPDADLLPADYVAAPAFREIRDVAYGPLAAQTLDLYLPARGAAPVVVFLHSGGWVAGGRADVPPMVLRFVELGYAVASVDYRLAPDNVFPAPVEDVKRATRWLKAYADREGLIDGDRLLLYGTSAGGHLAAFAATTPGRFEPGGLSAEEAAADSTVAGVVSVVGPTDLVALYHQPHPWAEGLVESLLGCDPCTEEQLIEASPTDYLHPGVPPAYWVYGENDCLVDPDSQGAAIATAWAEQAGPDSSWFDRADGCGHNIDASLLNQRSLEAFVERVIGDAAEA